MSNTSNLIKKELFESPKHYFEEQKKTLDDRLKSIEIDSDKEKEIRADASLEIVRDKVLGLFKIGELVNTILQWNEDIDSSFREAKKEYLLVNYFDRTDNLEEAVNAIRHLLTNPQGNTLFNKILRILDDSPPDLELSRHLSIALACIAKSDFEKLFGQHKYALSQIEILTPQALTILADFRNWPKFRLGSFSTSLQTITSDWSTEFSITYAKSKGITESQLIERISYSLNELISKRLIEGQIVGSDTGSIIITNVGQLLLLYIDQNRD